MVKGQGLELYIIHKAVNGPLAADTISYTYDSAGRISAKLDAKGQTIAYTYGLTNFLAYLKKIKYIKAGASLENRMV